MNDLYLKGNRQLHTIMLYEMTKEEGIERFGENLNHYCIEWDFMIIDKDDPKFECCLCFTDDLKQVTI